MTNTYKTYKPSGIDWIGDIPSHWDVKKLKYSFKIVNGSTPESGKPSYWDGDITWVTPSDLSKLGNTHVYESERKITAIGLSSCGTTIVPPNSIILTTRAPIGNIAISGKELCTNQGCKSLIPQHANSSHFYYQLLSAKEHLQALGTGTTFKELSTDSLKVFKVACPPLAEQTAIARYLDEKTAQLDTLIDRKRRLIALLREEKTALINEAVTKGIQPNVPMRDSGIEWLGAIPAHWEVKKLKFISETISKGTTPSTEGREILPEGEVRFIKAENIQEGRLCEKPSFYIRLVAMENILQI